MVLSMTLAIIIVMINVYPATTAIPIIWVRICPGFPYNAPVHREFMNGAANIPVARAPQAPPIPCIQNTSSASSYPKRFLTVDIAK